MAKPEAGAAQKVQSKSATDWIGIGIFVVLAANVGAVIYLGMYFQKMAKHVTDLEEKMKTIAVAEANERKPASMPDIAPRKSGPMYPLDGFLVNLSTESGNRFLQLQMELELESSSTEAEISLKKAAVRDAIIVLLSSQTYASLRTPGGLANLRSDIRRAVNSLLTKSGVREVYFTQFHFN